MDFMKRETAMWESAKNRNSESFLELVEENAVMICGGYRCSGFEYAQIIKEFDVAEYQITNFGIIEETEQICQIHYIIDTKVADLKNKDLEGKFHITSTWKNIDGVWKLIFNMDSRILN